MDWSPIAKPRGALRREPCLKDYEQARRAFSWEDAFALLEGLPGGAGDQGKFWEYHDYIMGNQRGENAGWFSERRLTAFAEALGLDTGDFSSCLNGGEYREMVRQELFTARDLGIQSTPTFVISYQAGGQTVTDMIKGAEPFSTFQQRLDAALAAAGAQ